MREPERKTARSDRLVLVVEDDDIMRVSLEDALRLEGIPAASAATVGEALGILERGAVDLVVTDIRLPDGDGRALFHRLSRSDPGLPVIVMTAYGSIPEAVELVKAGAVDYLTKPFVLLDFIERVQRALAALASQVELAQPPDLPPQQGAGILGRSPVMQRIERLVARIAPLDSSVLITGESGVGKEVLASLIHANSRRAAKPFVRVNCAAIPHSLVESELFGHEKGAFTGADRRRIGYFEQANGGTIFLDEIAETPADTQVKLLRVLQERMLQRVGGGETVPLDVRVVAATQVDLDRAMERGTFRADLYWRLNVIHVAIPPLRERRDDIVDLARRFVGMHATAMQKRVTGLSRAAEDRLLGMAFPGNVRELKNLLERAVALCDGPQIEEHDLLPLDLAIPPQPSAGSLRLAVEQAERQAILRALTAAGGHVGAAADRLGISRKNLWEKMRRYGIERAASE